MTPRHLRRPCARSRQALARRSAGRRHPLPMLPGDCLLPVLVGGRETASWVGGF